jgi:hypothetical protein
MHLAASVESMVSGYKFMAVDLEGTAYAVRVSDGANDLWASEDEAKTWSRRGQAPSGFDFRIVTVLSDDTLLADVMGGPATAPIHNILRSTDHGATWTPVLSLGTMSLLTPHSVDELDGIVFVGEYQAYTLDSVPVHLWASSDRGVTWQALQDFTDRRHCHGVRADPDRHELWMFFGDDEQRTGLVRSTDDGNTFTDVIRGHIGSAVDGLFTSSGLVYGEDVVYGTSPPEISVMGGSGEPQPVTNIPGPSYSIHAVQPGGFVLGTTHEPGGNVYAPGDDSAHLLGSGDGSLWNDLLSFQRVDDTDYARADVYWTFPDGTAVLQLYNVQPVGDGYGYAILSFSASP